MKTCLKCGFDNPVETIGSFSACPKCGAIYARVEASRSVAKARVVASTGGRPRWLGIVSVIALIALMGAGVAVYVMHAKEQREAAEVAAAVAAAEEAERVRVEKFEADMARLTLSWNVWTDAFKIAQSTSRMALATPMSQMQAARRAIAAEKYDGCLVPLRDKYIEVMAAAEDGFLAFMGDHEAEATTAFAKGTALTKDAHLLKGNCTWVTGKLTARSS